MSCVTEVCLHYFNHSYFFFFFSPVLGAGGGDKAKRSGKNTIRIKGQDSKPRSLKKSGQNQTQSRLKDLLEEDSEEESRPGGGGFSHWHGIRICACLLGHFFAKFGIAIGGFSSETKEPKLHKLGVFWANYCKKHPIWSKLGAFLSKMVYWWVGNLAKNWYRDSQIFEVRQAHPRTILVKEPPPGSPDLTRTTSWPLPCLQRLTTSSLRHQLQCYCYQWYAYKAEWSRKLFFVSQK